MLESPKPDREKLKSDYSLLQSSDLRVEVALKLSTVNCQLAQVFDSNPQSRQKPGFLIGSYQPQKQD
ncbi:MAG: hypothetical protein JGK08_17195 [Microcoleus sp. PH2017_04_SCI_O_A]|nr:hypothetical protein [Microcoleus sp. PH2017_04_SCI_O_A]